MTGPTRVVIVDDDPALRFILERELSRRDPEGKRWDLAVAGTPDEALALVRDAPADRPLLVLTDYDLQAPMNGGDVIVAARRMRPDATLVLCSGHPRGHLESVIALAKPAAFLEKAHRADVLVERLVPLIDGARGPRTRADASPDGPDAGATGGVDADGLQRLLDSLTDHAVVMLDADGRVVTWNRGAERMKRWTAAEAKGRHVSAFYPPRDVANSKPEYDLRVANHEGRREDAGWRVRKDGSTFWAHVVLTPLRGEDGTLLGYSEVTRDVTERHHHEEALHQSEERYRLIVESVKDYAIFMLDASGRVASWNEGAERIKGYRADEIVGEHLSRFYTPEDRAAGKPDVALGRAVKEGRFEAEAWRVRKDGSRFWANVVLTPLFGNDGGLRGFAKVTRDLTERRRDEQALRARARDLAEVARELEAFNYTVAHDLRAPLRGITAHLDELLGEHAPELDEDERRELIEGAHRSALRMGELVDDLLELSLATQGDLAQDDVDLTTIAREVFDEVTRRMDAENVKLVVQPDLHATGDGRMLRVVLENLISNAVKFTRHREDARVEVGGVDDGDVRIYHVKDNGVGFDSKLADRLFRPFQRLHAADEFEGTGVGLATVERIVRRHHGRAWARGAPGEGATVYFTLPRRVPPTARAET